MENNIIYDFDYPVDRSGSNDYKHFVLEQDFGSKDLIALWVADMDFFTPQFITDAIKKRLEHSLFGYTKDPLDYWPTVAKWIREHHDWDVKPEWLTYIPGIVKGIGFAVNCFLKPGDKVIIQSPVYHPFHYVPEGNGHEVVVNRLRERKDGLYDMDFDDLERVIDDDCRMLILCNPHNPGGVVWKKETLQRLASFCKEHGIIVISDEIHCDMALYGHKHVPFASVSDDAASISITFGAPSKTFNMAGIVSSYAIVPDENLRNRFYSWLESSEFNETHLFAPIATIAAYKHGEDWRRQMLKYVEGNIDFVCEYVNNEIPGIKAVRPEASYLVWLDCRELHLKHEDLVDLFVKKAKLALNDGEMFGIGGEGHMRMNCATQRAVLRQAVLQLRQAVISLL